MAFSTNEVLRNISSAFIIISHVGHNQFSPEIWEQNVTCSLSSHWNSSTRNRCSAGYNLVPQPTPLYPTLDIFEVDGVRLRSSRSLFIPAEGMRRRGSGRCPHLPPIYYAGAAVGQPWRWHRRRHSCSGSAPRTLCNGGSARPTDKNRCSRFRAPYQRLHWQRPRPPRPIAIAPKDSLSLLTFIFSFSHLCFKDFLEADAFSSYLPCTCTNNRISSRHGNLECLSNLSFIL